MVVASFPEAEFQVYEGEDPQGVYINAYTNTPSGWNVINVVSERVTDILLDEGYNIGVVPSSKVAKK
ncbi:MAG: hypothetical protein HW403_1340 [Dehalococcoidia bacterium]|nr:hypothetical protein [Dehalococcoidia bacterium]